MQLLHYTLQYTYLLYTSFSRKTDPTDFEFNCFFLKKKKLNSTVVRSSICHNNDGAHEGGLKRKHYIF
jgi:hypothetical protein